MLAPGEFARLLNACVSSSNPTLWFVPPLSQQVEHRLGPMLDIPHATVRRRVTTEFSERRNIAGDHRGSTCHGLDDGQSEPFALGGQQDQRRTSVDGGKDVTL